VILKDWDSYFTGMPVDPDIFGEGSHGTTITQMEITPLKPSYATAAPTIVTFQDVSAAAFRIAGAVERTPCICSHLSKMFNMKLYFKMEQMQFTGSVSDRGARYALTKLSPEQREQGVICASSGNHALALAYHGQQLGIPVKIILPQSASLVKISGCREYGAEVILEGNNVVEARSYAKAVAEREGRVYVNGNNNPHVIAGKGTMALEILEQVPDVDAIIIPTGGGALIAGSAVAVKTLKPHVKIYGVEPAACPSFCTSLKQGEPTYVQSKTTVADGLAIPLVGQNALATAAPHVDRMLLVDEESISTAVLRLVEVDKVVIEGGGAVGLAAICQGICPELEGKNVVVALCGGNIDTRTFARCLERGLATNDRLCRFVVRVTDRPGGIAELTVLLAKMGASIKDIFQERAWIKSDVYAALVKCVIETRDAAHSQEVETKLREKYEHLVWGVTRQSYG